MSDAVAIEGPVLVVGTGLIGTSIALALRRAGVDVALEDASASALQEAVYRGAGTVFADQQPTLVVVAVPPAAAPGALAEACVRFPDATVTDTTSVKGGILDAAISAGADPHRLVGGHPMAGRESSGPSAARADLLDDRLWVLTPTGHEGEEHLARVRRLIDTCGASPVEMDPAEHDAAVALVSHAPQLVASTLAATLVGEPAERIQIAGQGLADTTRIAGSDPELWTQILTANAAPVAVVLDSIVEQLRAVRAALTGESDERAERANGTAADEAANGAGLTGLTGLTELTELLAQGREGRSRLPGKHGTAAIRFAVVPVMVADKPGELARLFVAAGDLEVNLEDVRIEHVLGRPSGLVDLFVRPDLEQVLIEGLTAAGFDVRA